MLFSVLSGLTDAITTAIAPEAIAPP